MTFHQIKIATVLIALLTGSNAWSSNVPEEENLLNSSVGNPHLSPSRLTEETQVNLNHELATDPHQSLRYTALAITGAVGFVFLGISGMVYAGEKDSKVDHRGSNNIFIFAEGLIFSSAYGAMANTYAAFKLKRTRLQEESVVDQDLESGRLQRLDRIREQRIECSDKIKHNYSFGMALGAITSMVSQLYSYNQNGSFTSPSFWAGFSFLMGNTANLIAENFIANSD
jgi:hypothetical protein